MPSKDYYKILDVVPAASQLEIKKAYRQLAMKYHPDRNENNPAATAHFRQVQEAYKVLSDPQRRSAYNQHRWYRKSNHSNFSDEPLSPAGFLQTCRRLSGYITRTGNFRIDQQALYQYIRKLLSTEAVDTLLGWDDASVNSQIIDELLTAAKPLSFRYIKNLEQQLVRLANGDEDVIKSVRYQIQQRRWLSYWQKYQGLVILVAALVLCWLIYSIGK